MARVEEDKGEEGGDVSNNPDIKAIEITITTHLSNELTSEEKGVVHKLSEDFAKVK